MKPSETLGANSQAVCDCGNLTFIPLIRVEPDGNNHLVALRCTECEHELVTPYSHGGPAPGPTLKDKGRPLH